MESDKKDTEEVFTLVTNKRKVHENKSENEQTVKAPEIKSEMPPAKSNKKLNFACNNINMCNGGILKPPLRLLHCTLCRRRSFIVRIAKAIKEEFKLQEEIEKLKIKPRNVGDILAIKNDNRFILNLVTSYKE